jgi:hypothetical protein
MYIFDGIIDLAKCLEEVAIRRNFAWGLVEAFISQVYPGHYFSQRRSSQSLSLLTACTLNEIQVLHRWPVDLPEGFNLVSQSL